MCSVGAERNAPHSYISDVVSAGISVILLILGALLFRMVGVAISLINRAINGVKMAYS